MRFARDTFVRIGKPLALAALIVATATNCGKEPSGLTPSGFRLSRAIAFLTQFPSALRDVTPGSSGLVKFTKVHIVLYRADNTIALDQFVDFPEGSETVTVTLEVPLSPTAPASGELLTAKLDYVNATGETVFSGTAPVTATRTFPSLSCDTNTPVKA